MDKKRFKFKNYRFSVDNFKAYKRFFFRVQNQKTLICARPYAEGFVSGLKDLRGKSFSRNVHRQRVCGEAETFEGFLKEKLKGDKKGAIFPATGG